MPELRHVCVCCVARVLQRVQIRLHVSIGRNCFGFFFVCYYKECVDDEQSNQLVAPELYFLLLEVPPVLLIHEHEVQEVLDGELVVDIFV